MAFQHNAFQSNGFQVQVPGGGAPVVVFDWYDDFSVPQRRTPQVRHREYLFYVPPSFRVDWYTDLSAPKKRTPQVKHKEYLFFVQHAPANLDETYSVNVYTSAPIRRKTTQYQSFALGYNLGTPETITVDKWFTPLNEPLKNKRGYRGKNQLLAPFLAFETHSPASFGVPLVSIDQGGPVRRKTSQYQEYAIGWDPTYLEFVSLDKWFQLLNEPKRPRRNRIIGPDLGYVKHIPAEYLNNFVQLLETVPARKRRTLYQSVANQFELPVPVVVALVSSWYQDLNKPARRRRSSHPSVKYVIGLDPSGYPVPGSRRPREYSNRRYKDRYGMNIKSYGSRGLRR